MPPLRQRMLEELQLRNLSEATIHTYLRLVERFAKHFGVSPTQLGPDHVRQYLLPFGQNIHAARGSSRAGAGKRRRLCLPW